MKTLRSAMSEAEVQKQVIHYLFLLGAVPIRINSGGRQWTDRQGKERFFSFNNQKGCSDLLVCLKGRFVAIEVKGPKEPLEMPNAKAYSKKRLHLEEQKLFMEQIRKAGGVAFFVRSIVELESNLREHGLI